MATLHLNAKYYAVYIKLAKEFDLPIRMPSQSFLESNGLGLIRKQLAKEGILCPDFLMFNVNSLIKDSWKHILTSLQAGVTEILIHPAFASDEMQTITGDQDLTNWKARAAEYELFTKDAEILEILKSQNIKRIGYRQIRDLQRIERIVKISPLP